MTFEVKLFAYLREEHGDSVVVDSSPTAEALLERLYSMGIDTSACRLAVNQEFVEPSFAIKEGDELAVIPPVSGG
ncbi:MAG: hypothetical protein BGO01_15130 [Armatimonadetes bacterium 55-13]|nr:MoaD/ThiS family protein [Armatimonadota bacterium]OJU65201.1 MAG: hypothetical protein BGO01_15130 [Armatimonadetes bacterium 55-13]